MLLTCPSCNSQYLVNSIDLQPNGRKVHCVTCEYEWFQESSVKLDKLENENMHDKNSSVKEDYKEKLPSTFVVEDKVSTTNSILAILFIIILIFIYYFYKNFDRGILNLLFFYYENLYMFSLKSLDFLRIFIDNLALIIFKLFN